MAELEIDSEEKWSHSEKKDKMFMKKNNIEKENYIRPAGGLRICERCKDVITKGCWKEHFKWERNRRVTTSRFNRDRDGLYRCPIKGCENKGWKSRSSVLWHT